MTTRAQPRPTPPTAVTPDPVVLALALEAPQLPDEVMQRPSVAAQIGSLIAITIPFLGLIAAIVLAWHTPFSLLNLTLFLGGYLLTTLAITAGYHRLFTHKSYKAVPIVSVVLGVIGSMAVQGSILNWVATHRRHHQHTDRPDDPHSPHAFGAGLWGSLRGMVHSHFGWFFAKTLPREVMDKSHRVRDTRSALPGSRFPTPPRRARRSPAAGTWQATAGDPARA